MQLSKNVKHYPDVFGLAQKQRGDAVAEYAVWLLAQVIDWRRAGWVELPDLEAFVQAHDIKPLLPVGKIRRVLEEGVAFWTYLNGRADRPPRIYLKNIQWAMTELGVRGMVQLRSQQLEPEAIVTLFDGRFEQEKVNG